MTAKKLTYNQLFNKVVELERENEQLLKEIDALWLMLDEMKASDIQNYSSMLDDLAKEALTSRLMVSKVKGEA